MLWQLRLPADAQTCSADQLLACIERNLDASDTAAAFTAAIAKHSRA